MDSLKLLIKLIITLKRKINEKIKFNEVNINLQFCIKNKQKHNFRKNKKKIFWQKS